MNENQINMAMDLLNGQIGSDYLPVVRRAMELAGGHTPTDAGVSYRTRFAMDSKMQAFRRAAVEGSEQFKERFPGGGRLR